MSTASSNSFTPSAFWLESRNHSMAEAFDLYQPRRFFDSYSNDVIYPINFGYE